ncbi:MAG: glycosyltransferase family 9 protein [Bacteroidetes bacterium]|nr:glycosyltransferase family 9 protein [Bacteroidota bacterium]
MAFETERTERILIIRRHNHIGDMLCSLPLYAGLHRRWPEASKTLLAIPTRYDIPLAALNPFLDHVVYYRKGSLINIIRQHVVFRRMDFDLTIVPSTVAISRTSHITAYLTGAPRRIGIRSLDGKRNRWHVFLNITSDVFWNERRIHQMDRSREIAALAGCPWPDSTPDSVRLPVSEEATGRAEQLLASVADGRPLIGVHPGAGKAENIWPTERFAEVMTEIARDTAAHVVITSGPLDATETERLRTLLLSRGIDALVIVEREVQVLSALFRRFSFYLTNDAGIMHIAAFSGCPTVSLFGPTQSWEWAPRGDSHLSLQAADGVITSIDIDTVIAACRDVLYRAAQSL